jgi:hypothetical protein
VVGELVLGIVVLISLRVMVDVVWNSTWWGEWTGNKMYAVQDTGVVRVYGQLLQSRGNVQCSWRGFASEL